MSTLNEISLENLQEADLNNDEIIELIIMYAQVENIDLFRQHIQALSDKFNTATEVKSLEMLLFEYRDRISSDGYRNIYIALGSGYEELFVDLIQTYQNSPNTITYLNIINAAFAHEPDLEFCQRMLDWINTPQEEDADTGNYAEDQMAKLVDSKKNRMAGPGVEALVRYLDRQISRLSEYAPVPKYIRQLDVPEPLPKVRLNNLRADIDPRDIAEAIINEAENFNMFVIPSDIGDDQAETKQAVISRLAEELSRMSRDRLIKYIAPFKVSTLQVKEIQDNEDIFRVYGPVNPHPTDDYSDLTTYDFDTGDAEEDLDKVYGGPRMFLSVEYEYDYDNDLKEDDWFGGLGAREGVCQECLKRIAKRIYARRRALVGGGWVGCFCSLPCVLKSVEREFEGDDPDTIKIRDLNMALNEEFEIQLNEIGIADRADAEGEKELDPMYDSMIESMIDLDL